MNWFKVDCDLFEDPVFRDNQERLMWVYMLSKATWKEHRVRYRNRIITLLPGQIALTIRDLAKVGGCSKGKVERFLKRLKIEDKVRTKVGTNVMTEVSVLTLCNKSKNQNGNIEKRTERGQS